MLFVLGLVWASTTLQSNAAWVEIVVPVLRFDAIEPLRRARYEVNLAALMAGWIIVFGLVLVAAMRAPFRIRGAAMHQRYLRELEREIKQLRTLPLRQREEDELLAADAHIELGSRKVMIEQIPAESELGGSGLEPELAGRSRLGVSSAAAEGTRG